MSEAPPREVEGETPVQTATGDALDANLDRPWLTLALVGAIVVPHLLLAWRMVEQGRPWLEALVAPRGPRMLTRSGALRLARIDQDGEFWRFVSASFLHGDGLHLLLNGLALFLVTAMTGFAFSWLGGTPLSVGASGAIFGMMGAGIVFGWKHRAELPQGQGAFFRRKLLPWVLLNLGIGLGFNRLPWLDGPVIDNLAHLGGLVSGAILAMVLGNRVVPGEQGTWWTRGLMVAFIALVCGLALAQVWGEWQA